MKIKYSRFTGEDFGIGAEDLLQALADFLLESGFQSQYMQFSEMNEHTLEDLKQAIQAALERGELFSDEHLQEMMERLQQLSPEQMQQLVDRLVQKLVDEEHITIEEPGAERPAPGVGQAPDTQVKFEVTDKSLDFLGYKTLKDLLGSLGKSSLGRHDTRDPATGIEASGASRQYEFGDTLNLDVSRTLFSAIRREGAKVPIELEYRDLYVSQCEYQSSCATVLMLDCSHSMILYGEDRFTPAKKVALALAHLIRTQYPGDSLKVVLFHDDAEELPLAKLATTQVGPYHTNTAEGLKLARRILQAQRKEMKQIVMVTDGKPTACFLDSKEQVAGARASSAWGYGEFHGGRRLYKNSMGGDPVVMEATLREVQACRKAGIMINTFMLASDYYLVEFVKQMSAMTQGKAYFATPGNLTQFVLIDFLKRKKSRVR